MAEAERRLGGERFDSDAWGRMSDNINLAEAKALCEAWERNRSQIALDGYVSSPAADVAAKRAAVKLMDDFVPALIAECERLRDELDHATADEGDHLSKASRRMCETILRQAHAAEEKVRQLTKERDELGRAFDGEVARRVARDEEISRLTARRDELLATIARLSNELPFPDEVRGWTEQRAKLLAEIGTLKAERDEALAAASTYKAESERSLQAKLEAESRTAEAIAAWLERCNTSVPYPVLCGNLAADIRAGKWRQP